jgi:hypothetical protein
MKRSRKRLVGRVVGCALIGAAGTASVGLLGIYTAPSDPLSGHYVLTTSWFGEVPPDWPLAPELSWRCDLAYSGVRKNTAHDPRTPVQARYWHQVIDMGGWPFYAVGFEYLSWNTAPLEEVATANVEWQRVWRFNQHASGLVPELWPGFALDTAFYGTLVFLLWSAPGVVRRRARLRRGACPACGYDLKGGSAGGTCPECGA